MHDQSAAEAAVTQPALLLVDDDENILSGLGMLLRREGFAVRPFRSWDDPARAAAALCELVLLDVYLGAQNGHQVLSELIAADPLRPVILISGQAGPEEALRAIGSGAFDFIEKPFSAERLLLTVGNALRYRELNRTLVSRLVPVRSSPAMVSLCRDAARFARSGATVLIDGESGSGKDVLANLLHALSASAAGPLVKINCGAIPAELAESELFGHARGAFTGAEREYSGRIMAAQGGTLFLDEVAELPLPVQAKLLRFLENGELQRVGDQTPRQVQARVLAASNTSLDAAVKSGRFREDLFFRLAVLRLHVPPLRERRADILPLVDWFLDTAATRDGRPLPVLTDTARAALEAYSYPGNVRELRSIVERLLCHEGGPINAAVVQRLLPLGSDPRLERGLAAVGSDPRLESGPAGRGSDLHPETGPAAVGSDPRLKSGPAGLGSDPQADFFWQTMPFAAAKLALERQYLLTQYRLHGNSVKDTALALGLLPNNLSRRMRQLDIS